MSREKVVLGVGAFIAGVGVGALATKILIEDKVREKAALEVEMIQNAYGAAMALHDAAETIGRVEEVRDVEGGVEMDIVLDKPISEIDPPNYLQGSNPYHEAIVEASKGPDPGEELPTDEGIEYISEEDYDDEDGRVKLKVEILVDDGMPVFLMDHEPFEEWEDRIGTTILRDMFQLCPPGTDQILYVRNQRTDEDYEVTRVEP